MSRPDPRPSARRRGYDNRWDRARAAFLARHPWCAECAAKGRRTFATVVDHAVPHKGDMRLFWDTSRWVSLCATHHSRKTVRADGGMGKAPSPRCAYDERGWPIGADHPWNRT